MRTPSERAGRDAFEIRLAARVSRRGLLWVVGAAVASGCSGRRASAVDAARARDALRAALDRWKGGDAIDALKEGTPPIVAQDFDWMAGATLVAYEVEGEGKEEDINLKVPVRLTLRTRDGREVRKSVHYLVSTSPALTVFRDFH